MHVSLYVSNLAASVNFYSTFFGQPATKIKPGYAKYVLDSPSLIISFIENPERVQANFGHLGFQVETVEEMTNRLVQARAQGMLCHLQDHSLKPQLPRLSRLLSRKCQLYVLRHLPG